MAPTKTKAQALRSFDVADFPALTGREEEWRFTPLKRLRGLVGADSGTVAGPTPKYESDPLPSGMSVSTAEKRDPRVGSILTPFDRVSALAWTKSTEVTLVAVAPQAVLDEPEEVVACWADAAATTATRLWKLLAEAGSKKPTGTPFVLTVPWTVAVP